MDPAMAMKLRGPGKADLEADDYPTPSSIGPDNCDFSSGTESSDDDWSESLARPADSAPISCYMYAIVVCASLNSMNYGFSIGVSSGIGVFLRRDFALSDTQEGLFFSSLALTSALGGLLSNRISDDCGRLRNLVVAQVLTVVGLIWCALAQTFDVFLVGRLVVGMSIGIGMPISPMYIAETAPAAHRGKLTTWVTLAINIGITVGFIVNWVLSDLPDGLNWRAMTLSGALVPLVLLGLATLFMPESPRWLVLRGRADEAAEIIRRTHPAGEDVDAIVRGIERQIEEDNSGAEADWKALLMPERRYRRAVVLACFVPIAQQITGMEVVLMRAPSIFKESGIAPTESAQFLLSIAMGLVKCLFVAISALFVDTLGRKPLLVGGTAALVVSLVAIAIGQLPNVPGALVAVGVMMFVACFSLGLGPLCWVYTSELFPSLLRGRGMSLAVVLNRLTSTGINFTFLPLCGALGGQFGYFALLAAITAGVAVIAAFLAFETKGLSLEEGATKDHQEAACLALETKSSTLEESAAKA